MPNSAFGEFCSDVAFLLSFRAIWDVSKVGSKIMRSSVVSHFATFLCASSIRFLILINRRSILFLSRCLLCLFLRHFHVFLTKISRAICCPRRNILVKSRLPISINFPPSKPVKKLRTPGSKAMMD